MTADRLQQDQILRYAGDLWRVDFVNDSRAFIIPLDRDGSRGISISPNSSIPVVTDIERARTELELKAVEKELRTVKAEIHSRERLEAELAAAEADLARARAEHAERKAARATTTPTAGTTRGGTATWTIVPGDHLIGSHLKGSTKAEVMAFLKSKPGATTKEVQAACSGTPGAVAACLDRFWDAGVLIKTVG